MPGGPCSVGVIEIGEAKREATAKSAGGEFVSTNPLEGSTAAIEAVPDVGCE